MQYVARADGMPRVNCCPSLPLVPFTHCVHALSVHTTLFSLHVRTYNSSLPSCSSFLLNYSGHFFFSLHVSFRRREENSGFGGPSVGLLLPPPLLLLSLSRSAPPTDDGLLLRVPLSQLLPLRRTEDGATAVVEEEERGNVVGAREKGEKRGREGGLPTSFLGAFRQGRRIAFPLYTLPPHAAAQAVSFPLIQAAVTVCQASLSSSSSSSTSQPPPPPLLPPSFHPMAQPRDLPPRSAPSGEICEGFTRHLRRGSGERYFHPRQAI